MSFIYPGLLGGLLAATAPVIIYFLLRRRKSEVPWGASYLLRKTLASKRKSSVWKQYVVLALRCLILALMAFLIAQPFRDADVAALAPALPDRPVHRVLVMDDSLSMTVSHQAVTRDSRAKSAVRHLLATQRPGDRVTLVSMTNPREAAPHSVHDEIAPVAAERVLDRVVPTEAKARLNEALTTAVTALSETPDAAGELYLFSDFPREMTGDVERLDWFTDLVGNRDIRVAAVNAIEQREQPLTNVAVLGASMGSDLVIAGVPVSLYVDVVNYADVDTPVQISLSGDVTPTETTVSLQANERRKVRVDVLFAEAGVADLRVAVSPSLLPSTSHTALSVTVRKQLLVWLYAAKPPAGSDEVLAEVEFLNRVSRISNESPIQIEPATPLALASSIPPEVDVVIIAGPRAVTEAMKAPLQRFVRRGGGLLLSMSPSVNVELYNNSMSGFVPATFAGLAYPETDPETFVSARTDDVADSSLLSEFGDKINGELAAGRIYNYIRVEPTADAVIHFRLANRDPLLLSRQLGRGQVVLWTTSLGIAWSSLPVRQSYLPFVYRLLNFSARGRGFPRNLSPGAAFVAAWPEAEDVTLTQPDGEQVTVSAGDAGGRAFLVSPIAQARGLYQLAGREHQETFTVVAEPVEGDMRTLEGSVAARLEAVLGTPLFGSWPEAVQALGPSDANRPLWPWILLAILVFYLIEVAVVRTL